MSATWHGDASPPPSPPFGVAGWIRILVKLPVLAFIVFGGLLLLSIVRLIERPFYGLQRPVTPHITVFVCRLSLRILGIALRIKGRIDPQASAVVANHSSWLDIFVLNARQRVYFVSKSEVARWPGIGWLAQATGTVFIERNPRKAAAQKEIFRSRIAAGHRLLFFPEGTSSDGKRVLPFKSTLFAAFFDAGLRDHVSIQPVTLRYTAPQGQDARFFGWWGDMDFGSHFLQVVAAGAGGQVTVTYHSSLVIRDATDRKVLAGTCENAIRRGLEG